MHFTRRKNKNKTSNHKQQHLMTTTKHQITISNNAKRMEINTRTIIRVGTAKQQPTTKNQTNALEPCHSGIRWSSLWGYGPREAPYGARRSGRTTLAGVSVKGGLGNLLHAAEPEATMYRGERPAAGPKPAACSKFPGPVSPPCRPRRHRGFCRRRRRRRRRQHVRRRRRRRRGLCRRRRRRRRRGGGGR